MHNALLEEKTRGFVRHHHKGEKPDHLAAESPNARSPITIAQHFTVTEYLQQAAPSFRDLDDLRRKVAKYSLAT
jgi:hypothetical protein